MPASTSTVATAPTNPPPTQVPAADPIAPLAPAPLSESARLRRIPLRRKGATLTAVQVQTASEVRGLDESVGHVAAGDWMILNMQGMVVGHVAAKDFPAPYEIVAEGTLTLTKTEREALEAVAGVGTTQTGASLLAACQRLARIRIGDVTIPFTPGQLEELQARAVKRGQTTAQAMQAVVDRIKDELFWKG
jgi:hypothetical protein